MCLCVSIYIYTSVYVYIYIYMYVCEYTLIVGCTIRTLTIQLSQMDTSG